MKDEMRNNLGRLDPMHSGVPTEPPTTTSARFRMERAMSTRIASPPQPRRAMSRPWLTATAAAAVVAIAVVGVVAFNGGAGADPEPFAAPPMELSLGEGDAMMSCIQFDIAVLADMPVAFGGTATAVDADRVTLDVDRWYKGGDASQVTLIGQAGLESLIVGIDFETELNT